MGKIAILLAFLSFLAACTQDNEPELPSVEERVKEAKSNLRNELTSPENGWKVAYQPTAESGTFLILLDFDEEGNVRIKSDVSVEDGTYYDQTISYRIDNAHGIELILENYAVFHFMFEQDAATFGAEFEFLYKEKDGDNLVFESISDESNATRLVFTPAEANAETTLARELSSNLEKFAEFSPDNYRAEPVNQYIPIDQQVVLEDQNISVFWSLNAPKRIIQLHGAGIGTDADQIFANDDFIGIFHESGYSLENGKIKLRSPLSFTLDGKGINLESITLDEFDNSAEPFCSSNNTNGPKYTGQAPGIGNVSLINSLYSNSGSGFQPGNFYSVNVFFVSDGEGNALSEEGTIQEIYPNASGFYFFYGADLVNDSIPSYSIGFGLDDGSIHLRSFEPTTTDLNKINVNFTDNYYFSGGSTQEKIDNLNAVTNEIFDGGTIYAYDYPIQGFTIFRMYNPCNAYEMLLVQ